MRRLATALLAGHQSLFLFDVLGVTALAVVDESTGDACAELAYQSSSINMRPRQRGQFLGGALEIMSPHSSLCGRRPAG